ncbi:hypothetical protein ACFC1L_39915 [Streptomyces sp. NPDC056210]|uniref:hypothetical protein n=1 Tax=Streptomyces sp. NPDC056210 TaxID=3345746 RepID=UPI0035DEBAA4
MLPYNPSARPSVTFVVAVWSDATGSWMVGDEHGNKEDAEREAGEIHSEGHYGEGYVRILTITDEIVGR